MRETIGKILDIEREQERRYRNSALKRYNTGEKIHRKQLEFHRCQKRNRWVFGGNRTGKTEWLWAVLFCVLLVYELRDSRKRESRYTLTISSLSDRLGAVNGIGTAVTAVGEELAAVRNVTDDVKTDTADIRADVKKLAGGAV